MSITKRDPTMNREYTQKLETHSTNYEVHTSQIHPIILSDQCTIHPESLKKINQFCRVDKFLRSTARSIIKSHGNRTRIYNEAVKQHAEELQQQFTTQITTISSMKNSRTEMATTSQSPTTQADPSYQPQNKK
ncbi:Hypothetical_protein [Hexamita inflata]|uniref:Hypothetical_protein n=1 Tax=Hexamita inflata TaxID=28002 RepID=A0AA86TYW8_9EUKA|nr:Hypothetical protein HINF_LOCUS6485 [Hexamita inflata]CAI9932307.1 Hypothetical protein HINF_LOCUS19952 [Hexamita inflata]